MSLSLSHPSIPCRYGRKHVPITSMAADLIQRDLSPSSPAVRRTCRYCISNTAHSSSSSPTQCPSVIPMVFILRSPFRRHERCSRCPLPAMANRSWLFYLEETPRKSKSIERLLDGEEAHAGSFLKVCPGCISHGRGEVCLSLIRSLERSSLRC